MANKAGQIQFGVGFNVDQSSLSKIKSSLKEIQNLTTKDIKIIDAGLTEQELNKVKKSAGELQTALQRSFNSDLGTLNIAKFNSELKNLDLNTIQRNLASIHTTGQKAFKDITAQVLTTNMQLKQTSSFFSTISTTMFNALKWGTASGIMNSFSNSIQQAAGYVKALDTSLTNIRVVTGQSKDEMAQFAVEANEAAAALGRQTKEYAQAALTFYQQGLDDTTVKERTETVLKASNITGESTKQMAEYLTAVWNGFQVSVGEEANVVSKLAAVADSSASDMAELATAMSKVSSTAGAMGVNVDQLSAQIATIIATTRQAPESVGNALKTIYARIADIKAGTEENGVTLGNYSDKMAQLGFNVLDASGRLKDMGSIIEEVGNSWENLSREQQVYLAQTMAGQRQYNNLIALFDHWGQYSDALNISLNAQGTLEQKNAIYMESLAAHLKQLSAAKEGLISSLVNGDSFKGTIDSLTTIVNLMTKFVESIGGGGNALTAFGGIMTSVFSKQLGTEISNLVVNFQNAKHNANELAAQMDILTKFKDADIADPNVQTLIKMKEQILNLSKAVTAEEHNMGNEMIMQTHELQNQQQAWDDKIQKATEYYNKIAENTGSGKLESSDKIDNLNSDQKADIASNFEKEEKYLKDISTDLKEYETSVKKANDALFKHAKVVSEADRNSNKMKESDDRVNASLGDMANSVNKVSEAFEILHEAGKIPPELQKNIDEAQHKYAEAVESGDQFQKTEAADELVAAYKKAMGEITRTTKEAKKVLDAEMNGASQGFQQRLDEARRKFDQFIKSIDIRKISTELVNAIGALGRLGSSLSMLSNIPKILDNDSLADGEKFLQVITNLGFAVPMFAESIMKLKDSFATLAPEIGKCISALAAMGPLGIAIVAGVAALGVAIKVAYDEITKYDRAIKEANKTLKHQQELLALLQKQYGDLNSAMSSLANQKNALKDLTKGTLEWNTAVTKLNTDVLDLIKKFPQLAASVKNVNGVLEISQSKFKALLEEQNEAIIAQQTEVLQSQADVFQAQQDKIDNKKFGSLSSIDSQTATYSERNDLATSVDMKDIVAAVRNNGVTILDNTSELSKTLNISQELATEIANHKEQVIKAIDATRQNTLALQNANEQAVGLKNQNVNIPEELRDIVNIVQASRVGQDQTDYVKELKQSIFNEKIQEDNGYDTADVMSNIEAEEQMIAEYFNSLGMSANQAKEDLLGLHVILENGKQVRKKDIETWYNHQHALDNATTDTEDLAKQLKSVKSEYGLTTNAFAVAMRGANTGIYDFSTLTREEINQVGSFVNALKNADNKIQELDFKFNPQNLSTESDQEESRNNITSAITNAETKGGRNIGSIMMGKGASEESVTTTISNLDSLGEKGSEIARDIIKDLELPSDKIADFARVLAEAQSYLNQDDGWNNLVSHLREVDVSVPTNSLKEYVTEMGYGQAWENKFAASLNDINNVIANFNTNTKLSKSKLDELQESFSIVMGTSQNIEEIFPELGMTIQQAFDPDLNGTSKQLVALQTLQEKAEEINISKAAADLEEAGAKLNNLRFDEKGFKRNISEEIDDALLDVIDKEYKLDVQLVADLKTDTDYEGQIREWIDNLRTFANEGAQYSSEVWTKTWDALYAYSEQFAEQAGVSIAEAFHVSDTGIVEFKDEYINCLDEILQKELETSGESVQNEIASVQAKNAARASELRALAAASQAYEEALANQVSVLQTQISIAEQGQTVNEAELESARQNVAEKKGLFETKRDNLIATSSDEIAAYEKLAEGAVESSNDQQDANIKAAQTAADAASDVANSWAAAVKPVSDSSVAITTALKSIADAQQAIANGGQVAVFGGTSGPGSISISSKAQKNEATKTGSYKASEQKTDTKDAQETAKKLNRAQQDQLKKLKDELTQVQEQLTSQKKLTKAYDNAADKIENVAKDITDNQAKHNAAQSGGGGGKGGGGKGGGKGKSPKKEKKKKEKEEKEPDHMDPFEDEDLDSISNKFHDIDQEIQRLTKDLDKLAKLQNRYLGSALVHNLNQQLGILKKQKSAYKEKLSIAKEELENQKQKLQAQGVEIGKNGSIKNYTEALKNKQEQVNSLVEKYNGETKEGQENLKGQVEAQKKSYNELKSQMGAYEQLNGQTLPEIEAQIAAIEEMIIELQIQKFNAVIELHLDWQSVENEYQEMQMKIAEFDAKFSTLQWNKKTGEVTRNTSLLEAAEDTVKRQRQADSNAEQRRYDAENKYKASQKLARSKAGREELAKQYGVNFTNKKEFLNFLKEDYQKTLDQINKDREEIYNKTQQSYYNRVNQQEVHTENERALFQQELDNINLGADNKREQLLKDYQNAQDMWKRRKKDDIQTIPIGDILLDVDNFKNKSKLFQRTLAEAYEESIAQAEKERNDNIQKAVDAYNQASDEVTEHNKRNIRDYSKVYQSQMEQLQKASDQLRNGDIGSNEVRYKSITKELAKHAEEISQRITTMNENTKIDKQGFRIMGTDKLRVGNTNPLTGKIIENKAQLKQLKKAIGKDKAGEIYADMQAKIVEDGKKYIQELQNVQQQLMDQITKAFELWQEAIDKQIDVGNSILEDYEHLSDIRSDQKKLLKLIGQENSEQYQKIAEQQRLERQAEIDRLQGTGDNQGSEGLVNKYLRLYNQYKNDTSEEGQEAAEKYYQAWLDASNKLRKLQIEQLEEVKEKNFDKMRDDVNQWEKELTGGTTLEDVKQQWSDITTIADMYLSKIDKAYEIQKLRAKYTETINSTTDVKLQEKLQAVMEKRLEALQEAEHLSQAEVQHENDLYDVIVKQAALEEAKNNKSNLRLRRDSQGNYSYQFTANEDDVNNKEQELLDALKTMEDNSIQAQREMTEAQMDWQINYRDQLFDLIDKYESGDITEDEFKTRVEALQNRYDLGNKIIQEQFPRIEDQVREAETGLLVGMQGYEGIDQLAEDMNLNNEQATNLKQFLDEVLSKTGNDGLFGVMKSDTGDIINAADKHNNSILTDLGNNTRSLQETYGNNVTAMQDYLDRQYGQQQDNNEKNNESLGDKLVKDADQTREDLKQEGEEIARNMDDSANTVSGHIEDTNQSLGNLDSTLRDLYNTACAIAASNTEAFATLNATVNTIKESLLRMTNESDAGSNTGVLSKNVQATFGHYTTDADKQKGQEESRNRAMQQISNSSKIDIGAVFRKQEGAKDWTDSQIESRTMDLLNLLSGEQQQQLANNKALRDKYIANMVNQGIYTSEKISDPATDAQGKAKAAFEQEQSLYNSELNSLATQYYDEWAKQNGYIMKEILTASQIFAESNGEKNAAMNKKKLEAIDWYNNTSNAHLVFDKKQAKNGRVHVSANGVALGWIDMGKFVGFDTGGYTGDWSGPDGKLALLHKKEMILNKDDTVNMLNAVKVAESITDSLQALGASALSKISSGVKELFTNNSSKDTLQQEVHINANFPNVKNQSEIEQALSNLVNVAAQKASSNRRKY